ncbi:hypothetical protein KC338_g203 [Hortaea werneckii]|nr:hypothetical protein KC338_g203 [Hortaea werneckii]
MTAASTSPRYTEVGLAPRLKFILRYLKDALFRLDRIETTPTILLEEAALEVPNKIHKSPLSRQPGVSSVDLVFICPQGLQSPSNPNSLKVLHIVLCPH